MSSNDTQSAWYHRLDNWLRTSTLYSFDGRISIKTFWLRGVLPLIGLWVLFLLIIAYLPDNTFGAIVAILLLLKFVGMVLAVVVKRLHDRDKSMWWIALYFIPIIGAVWAFIELGFLDGTPVENRYGNPQVSQKWVTDDAGD